MELHLKLCGTQGHIIQMITCKRLMNISYQLKSIYDMQSITYEIISLPFSKLSYKKSLLSFSFSLNHSVNMSE